MISVIIPTLNSAERLSHALRALAPAAMGAFVSEVVVVDAGSTDQTRALADDAGCEIVESAPGRALQMMAGAKAARRQWLLFIHAETQLAPSWEEESRRFISANASADRAAAFRYADAPLSAWLRGLVKLPHGAQGLLISRRFYDALGGYRDVAMEDLDLAWRIGARRLSMLRSEAIIRP
ncbi:MAG: glycosyltransferase [Hyphomonadaceae bacterium]|nr:glycosyltransferase [Hyphomonadaceae bacterium]